MMRTLPTGGTLSPDPTTGQFEYGMPGERKRVVEGKRGAVGGPGWGVGGCVTSVAYSPDGRHIVSGSDDKTIRMWDAETGVSVGGPLMGHSSWVRSVAYSPDGRHIVSGSNDRTIRIWNAR